MNSKMRKLIKLTLFAVIIAGLFIGFNFSNVFAAENTINCSNRFVTLVNPVRGRIMWGDRSLAPIKTQYESINKYKFPATWLLQYDSLIDGELRDYTKTFDSNQEIGVFLEVTPELTLKSRVVYPHAVDWANPAAIFLSGYSQSDRRKLIDKLFLDFKDFYGYFPKSVGAWWIDSYSLNYMKEKYGINAAMIVADQKTTDRYGVWGQWWGFPYFPSKANILIPAKGEETRADVAIIQWAQRHPDLAYGEGPVFSNYSFQANDYIRQGKSTIFFKDLINTYLNCENPVAQVTIGLETGMESIGFNDEYQRQLSFLWSLKNIKFLSMSKFAVEYEHLYPQINEFVLQGPKTKWILNKNERRNEKLGDLVKYSQQVSFSDYFIKDSSSFLDRRLTNEELSTNNESHYPFYVFFWLFISIFLLWKKKFEVWLYGTFFLMASFGLILKSGLRYGWFVFYGPVVSNLLIIQTAIVVATFILFYFLKSKHLRLLVILSFGLDYILSILRYSYFSGSHYLGVSVDALRFVGFKITPPFSVAFVNTDFISVIASSLLRFNFDKIWNHSVLSLIVYPLIHILIAYIVLFQIKHVNSRFQKIVLIILVILFTLYLGMIINSDPRVVILNR